MGILFGVLCLISVCLLFIKALMHHAGWKKAHKYFCVAFIVFCFCHIIFVFPVLKNRHLAVMIAGIASALIFLSIVVVYHKTSTNHKKMLHWHRLFSFFLFISVVIHIVVYYIDFGAYQNKVNHIVLQEIETNSLNDGEYIGEYDAGYIYAKVRVTISKGEIAHIEILEHKNERGKPAEQIAEQIVDMQKFPVDVISGATNSSRVIQQAIQEALKGGNSPHVTLCEPI